jgi:nucleotide-binding universal stress UspA family protein
MRGGARSFAEVTTAYWLEDIMSAPVLAHYDTELRELAPARFAAPLAAIMGAPLMVAAAYAGEDVVDPLAAGQMGEGLPRVDPGEALAAAVRELGLDGDRVETLALGATSAPRALHLAAVEFGAGLLVVAPGLTAERLLDGAPCAVAVVPPTSRVAQEGAAPIATVGAGFVDTHEGQAGVRSAQALARRAGARLRVLCVVRAGDRGLRARAEEAATAALHAEPGVPVDIDVDEGNPDDLLVSASSDVDLLVCGSRCYGPPGATVRGGVARRVTAEAACPVIVTARAPAIRMEDLVGD